MKKSAIPLLILIFSLLAACTAQPPAETAAPPAATPLPAGAGFTNPVLRANFPDPFLLLVDGTYYAYATNGSGKNVQTATSTDLVTWQLGPDGMSALADWVRLNSPDVWAPEVLRIGDQYLLYYTARDDASGKQCVGVAVSDNPQRGFRDDGDQPLVCQAEEGGTIDASPFKDGDRLYLYFKNDGNCCGIPTYIYVQELAADGQSLLGEPTRLVRNDKPWEGQVIEAPTMWVHDGQYYLFYSANSYAGFEYAVGYATCESVTGPCEDAAENPILASRMDVQPLVVGPGHQTLIQVGEQTWIVYHVWDVLPSGIRGDSRMMWIDRIDWSSGAPVILGPTSDPQLKP